MLVRERMTSHPEIVRPDVSVPDALAIMRQRKIRRFPVLDSKDRLVGIVSEKDLLYASPSTSLSVWEISSLLGQLKVEKVMSDSKNNSQPPARATRRPRRPGSPAGSRGARSPALGRPATSP
ncbi:MAG: CBS domain-containing protein [Spirochaetaceae bacterium]|nr:CBS domain-containing protein [Spirochaetaceae bacterium]